MKHYYLVCYLAPNDSTQYETMYCKRKSIFERYNRGLFRIYAITRISKKEFEELAKAYV